MKAINNNIKNMKTKKPVKKLDITDEDWGTPSVVGNIETDTKVDAWDVAAGIIVAIALLIIIFYPSIEGIITSLMNCK